MNKHMLLIFSLVFLATACDDYTSPDGVVKTAFKAVQDNNLKTFRKTLSKKQKEKIGNQESLDQIRQQLSEYSDLQLKEPRFLSEEGYGNCYQGGTVYKSYQVNAYESDENHDVVETLVVCWERYELWQNQNGNDRCQIWRECEIDGLYIN